MRLVDLRDLLLTIGPPIYHYFAAKEKGNYIVWAEDGEGASNHADDEKTIQVIQGTIDYFTRKEFDPVVEQLQNTLNSADITWKLNSIQHEQDTGYIHYEWLWEVDGVG